MCVMVFPIKVIHVSARPATHTLARAAPERGRLRG